MVVENTRYGGGEGQGSNDVFEERRRHEQRIWAWSPAHLARERRPLKSRDPDR
jgi:hypothetical protein